MSGTCYGQGKPNADFSPNPDLLPDHGPCNPQPDSDSHCCKIGDICLTNGLCMIPSGVYYNGGCTDSSLNPEICPQFCISGRLCPVDRSLLKLMVITGLNHWPVVCHGSAVKEGDFCCSIHRKLHTCCDTASNGLGIPAIHAALPVSARPDGASTVPTSVSTGTAPELISSVTTAPSSGSITGTYSTFEYQLRLAS